MRKRSMAMVVGGLVVLGVAAQAEEKSPVSGNVALTTDYVFRGISQTQEEPAIQGGFDYAHKSGFYAGLWGSNVNFGESDAVVKPADRAQLELDVYAGFVGKFKEKGSWDVGAIYYAYPGAASRLDYDYAEIYGKIGYDFGKAALQFAVNYTDEYFAESGTATYYQLNLSVPLPADFGLAFHVGRQEIDEELKFGTPDYTDYKIGVSKEIKGIGLALDYYDTDLSKAECFGGAELCDGRAVFTVSKRF